jgi:hypothetical protein
VLYHTLRLERDLESVRREIETVNRSRKIEQTEAAGTLRTLSIQVSPCFCFSHVEILMKSLSSGVSLWERMQSWRVC